MRSNAAMTLCILQQQLNHVHLSLICWAFLLLSALIRKAEQSSEKTAPSCAPFLCIPFLSRKKVEEALWCFSTGQTQPSTCGACAGSRGWKPAAKTSLSNSGVHILPFLSSKNIYSKMIRFYHCRDYLWVHVVCAAIQL